MVPAKDSWKGGAEGGTCLLLKDSWEQLLQRSIVEPEAQPWAAGRHPDGACLGMGSTFPGEVVPAVCTGLRAVGSAGSMV